VMDTKPLEHSDDLRSLLEVFAPRIAAEVERRRAEQERAQTLADLHNVIETIPDIVFALDTQGNVVKWNRRLEDVTGYSPEELLNKQAVAFVPPEEQARTAAAIQRVFMEGYAELEGHLLTKEHSLIPYHWTGALLKNSHGEPVGITGIGRDVSEKKRAEVAFRASEERYRVAYDETPTMYFTLAIDGTVRSVNRFGATQLGYLTEELVGHSVLDLFHECDKETVIASLSECLAKPETTQHWEFRKVRKDGNIIWVRETARASQSSTGETVVSVTCEDVTERKQAERILQHRLEFERLIASLSTHFIKLPASDIDAGINQALCSIGKFTDADRSYVFLFRNDGRIVDNTHEWCAGGVVPQIDNLQDLPTDSFPWIMARHRRGEVTHLPRVADLPPEASAEKEEFEREGIQSLLAVPIVSSRGVIGFLGFDLVRNERAWNDDDIALLKIVGEMLAGVIERKQGGKALRDSQDNLRQALQASSTGLWDWNTDTNEVSFSREWKRQLGYEESDLADVFESWRTHLHPDDHDRAIAFVQAYLANPIGKYQQEFRLRHKDGTYRWIEARASIVTEPDGRRVRLLGSHTDITERKRVEEALRLAKFSIDRAADAVYWIDPQAKILDVNEAASLMLGYSRDELCAMTVHDLNPDFQADMWPGFWAETQRSGTMVFETAHRAKNGELIPIEVSVNYLSHEGKEYHCAFVRNITDRKRAEGSLRMSEVRYRSLVDNAPIGIFVNEAGRFVYANREMQRILNASTAEQLLGMPVLDRIAPEFHHVVKGRIHQLMDNGQPVSSLDEQYVRLDGSRVDVSVTAIPASLDGIPVIQVLVLDVTERKQAEDALRKKDLELDHYFTSALDLLCIADVTGRFKRLNKAWELTLGYSLEELEGSKFLDYVHPDDLEATLHALGDLTEQKQVVNFVNRYRRKDGAYRWFEWKSIPDGELIYAAARDITERKHMEDALRTRECELQTALQERERISQDLHDGILQSLFAVGLNLEATKSLMAPKTRKTAGGSLDKSIDQLNRVMREIRNFIAGLGPDPIEGKDLQAAVQSMLTSLTEDQPTRVRLAVEKRAAQAISAEQSFHLFRVIQEAVSNCIRHGGAQEARVSLKMLKQGVRLSIRDNGRGFNQGTVKAGGYGLRNMAARARKISGRFTVLSKENQGTRIILDLPKEVPHSPR
jgi:PAS domain S-box-containing protein